MFNGRNGDEEAGGRLARRLADGVQVLSETWEINVTAIKLRAIVGGIAFSPWLVSGCTPFQPFDEHVLLPVRLHLRVWLGRKKIHK
jgi:hypothetical protein